MIMIQTIVLIVTALVGVILAIRFKEGNKLGLKDDVSNTWHYILLALILLIALAIRVWKFGSVPGGFNQDGAMSAVDAYALSQYGTDRFGMRLPVMFTAWGYGQMSVLLSYLSIPFMKIFGLNAITARLPALLVSMSGLAFVYLFIRKLIGKNGALVVLAFCAINPWHIMQSRWAIDCNMFPHFMLFSIYFLYLGMEKPKYLYISMVFFALTMYTYGIAFYAVPLFLVIACIYLLCTKKISIKQTLISLLVYIIFAWPIFAVMIINYFKLPTINTPLFTIGFFKDSMRSNDLVIFSNNFSKQIVANFKTFWNVVVLQKPDLPWNTIPKFGTVFLFSMPLIIFGIYNAIRGIKAKKDAGFSLILIWLFVGIASGIMVNGVNVNRINIIFYPIIILIGIAIYYAIKNFKWSLILFVLIYALAFTSFSTSYFGENNKFLSQCFYDGFGQSLQTVNDIDYDKIYITDFVQAKGYFNVSEILTMFHLKIDAQYFQGKKIIKGKNGKQLLPYRQRYNYVNFDTFKVNYAENAVYVINNNEIRRFDTTKFNVKKFQYFSALIPKR